MITLEAALNELVADGRISYDDAVAQSMRPERDRAPRRRSTRRRAS